MRSPIRVAYITHYADMYGANRSLLDLLLELKRTGEVVPHVIVAQDGPMVDHLRQQNIPYSILPFESWMVRRIYMGRLHHRVIQWIGYQREAKNRMQREQELLPRLKELMREWQIGLVHVNSSVIGIGHLVARSLKLPLVWHIREFAFKHYGLHPDIGHKGFVKALRQADLVIAISKAIKKEFEGMLPPSQPPVHIYDGILDDEEYRSAGIRVAQRHLTGKPFVFASIGYIHKSKGQTEAIRAMAELRARGHSVRMLMAGSGNADQLRTLAGALQMEDDVELLGFVDRPQTIYERADAMVLCSRHEALGRVTIEAMAHGLPVIGHASGGTPELIDHGNTGYLYTTETELVELMEKMVIDRSRTLEMGQAAYRSIGRKFSIKDRSREVLRSYIEVISARDRK